MIAVNNLSISFTSTLLFNDVSFIVNDKDRIGLVGENGAGKEMENRELLNTKIDDLKPA